MREVSVNEFGYQVFGVMGSDIACGKVNGTVKGVKERMMLIELIDGDGCFGFDHFGDVFLFGMGGASFG